MSIKLSLVVPCYNEEGNVENFLNEAKSVIGCYTDSYEIVFVNDGSSDSTGKNLKKLREDNKDVRIKIITFSRNFGKEAAMYAGLANSAGEYVSVIDADLQQNPSFVVKMAEILDSDADCDMVAAFQAERKEGKAISFLKKCFYKLISKASHIDFVTDASDFRTMRRCVVDTIVSLPEYHRFSKGIFSWVGYNTVSIPYEVRERVSGETKWGFKKLLGYAFDGIVAYSDSLLKLPLYCGALMGLISVILLIFAAVVDIFTSYIAPFAFYMFGIMLLIGSFICISVGVLGVYIGKIHAQVKQRPIYIVKEILTYEND